MQLGQQVRQFGELQQSLGHLPAGVHRGAEPLPDRATPLSEGPKLGLQALDLRRCAAVLHEQDAKVSIARSSLRPVAPANRAPGGCRSGADSRQRSANAFSARDERCNMIASRSGASGSSAHAHGVSARGSPRRRASNLASPVKVSPSPLPSIGANPRRGAVGRDAPVRRRRYVRPPTTTRTRCAPSPRNSGRSAIRGTRWRIRR